MFLTYPSINVARRLVIGVLLFGLTSTAAGIEVEGFTEPYRDIDVAAAETGLLEAVEVKEGDRVKAGQLLVRLDEAVLRATLAIAKNAMESQGRLESAEAELELQSKIVDKLHKLLERRHASPQEIERAESQKKIAAAYVRTIREEHCTKSLEYERVRLQFERRRLTSPIDGIVTQIFKDRGEFVSLSDPVVLKVVQLDPLLVVFFVPARHGRVLSNGETVDVHIADSAAPVQGKIEFVSPAVDPQSGTMRVRVRIPNPEERLMSGLPCRLILADEFPQLADVPGH